MKSLEEDLLPPNQFLRIRRSALVRLDAVRELHRASHGDFLIILQSGEELVLSRHTTAIAWPSSRDAELGSGPDVPSDRSRRPAGTA